MADDVYIYWLRIPADKSDDFIFALMGLNLVGEDNLRIMHTPDGQGEED